MEEIVSVCSADSDEIWISLCEPCEHANFALHWVDIVPPEEIMINLMGSGIDLARENILDGRNLLNRKHNCNTSKESM